MEQLKALFTKRVNVSNEAFDVRRFVADLEQSIDRANSSLKVTTAIVENISSENFGENTPPDVSATLSDLYGDLQRRLSNLGFESFNAPRGEDGRRIAENQMIAAVMGLVGAQDEARYKKALLACTRGGKTSEDSIVVSSEMHGAAGSIPAFGEGTSLENYNEKSQRDFRVVTAGYNLNSSRQDAFGEALYRTTVINPIEGGAVQILPYIAVVKDVFHSTTGQRLQNQEMNMVDAYRDPSILDDNSTLLIPCVADDASNADVFVAAATIPPHATLDSQNRSYNTAPLKFSGKKFDLIGVSQHNQLVAAGILDQSDTIDPAGRLQSIYLTFGGKAVKFFVERTPTAVFIPRLIGDTRGAAVDFETEDLVVNGSTKAVDGSQPAGVSELATRNWEIRLGLSVNGNVSLSKGTASFNAGSVELISVKDLTTGEILDPAGTDVQTVLTTIGAFTAVGYDLNVRFTNTNRRQRGMLLQTRALQFRHPIWMHAPITLPMSTMDDQGPGEVAKALTVATDIRNSNNAVIRALNYVAQLKETVGEGYTMPKFGEVEGLLSAMMRPVYRYWKLDVKAAVDTLSSGDRWTDITSLLLNTIKGLLFPAYRDSNIESVFQTITGNNDERPKFILATDREIANYLMAAGDDRTLGAYLKYDVVATNNKLMDGKLLVLPTRENPTENDILSWGQFFYVPTIVADLPISRNGQISREIAAVPFNLHVNNIPFAIEIDVVNLRAAMHDSLFNSELAAIAAAGGTTTTP